MSDRDDLNQPLVRAAADRLVPFARRPVDEVSALACVSEIGSDSGQPAPRAFTLRVLLHYKWSILAVFVVLATAGIAGIWTLLVPKYKATAIIEVSPVIPQLLAGKSDMVPLYESYRGGQADYLTNPVVLAGVLEDAGVRATNWYRATPISPVETLLDRLGWRRVGSPLDRLCTALQAEVPRGKQLIYVSMTATTRGEAKRIVDKVLGEYVRFTDERSSAHDNEMMGKLRKEIGDREVELATLEGAAGELRQQLGTGAPDELVKERALDLLKLESTVSSLKTDIEIARRTLEYSRDRNGGTAKASAGPGEAAGRGADAETNPAYLADARWQQLSDRLAAARRDCDRRALRFGESDSKLAELRRDRDDAETQLRAWEAQLDRAVVSSGNVGAGVGAMRESLQQMTTRLELLTQLLEEAKASARAVFTDAEKLAQKKAERDKTEEMRQRLERRLEELRMNREVAGSVRTFPAAEPADPDDDRRLKYTAGALFGALAASIGLALLRSKVSPTVDQAVEVVRPAHGTFLGRLPLRRRDRSTPPEECPLRMESVRMIRTALLNRLPAMGGSVVQITSAGPGSGKSTLAILLARSLAQGGKRVLLVDGDLHRPTLAQRFAIEPAPGLADVLADPSASAAAIRGTLTAGLSLLPVGTVSGAADHELLVNGSFSRLLKQWRREYEIVLLDSPPLLGAADAAILSGHADGTVMVVRERHCRREAVVDALAALSAAGGRLLGTVFVGSDQTAGYGYGYGYGYSYARPAHSMDAAAPEGPGSGRDSKRQD